MKGMSFVSSPLNFVHQFSGKGAYELLSRRPSISPCPQPKHSGASVSVHMCLSSSEDQKNGIDESDIPELSDIKELEDFLMKEWEKEETDEEKSITFPPDVPMLNTVILTGRLGADPELRNLNGKSPVCVFSLAVQDTWDPSGGRDQELGTSWFQVEAWGSLGRSVAKRARKGMRVGIRGRLDVSYWVGRDGHERKEPVVTAREFEILQSMSEQNPGTQQQFRSNREGRGQGSTGNGYVDYTKPGALPNLGEDAGSDDGFPF